MKLIPQHMHDGFDYCVFQGVLETPVFHHALATASQFPFMLTERTRASNPNRIWLNQMGGVLHDIAATFDSSNVKLALGSALGGDYYHCRTRAELCMDSAGSWLEPHADDPAKTMTLQLYLDGHGGSTSLGGTATSVIPNNAWAFDNARGPVHQLNPLAHDRISIIINYVNNEWRDQSVLV